MGDVVSSVWASQSWTARRSSSAVPPGLSRSQGAPTLACAASPAELAMSDKSHLRVLDARNEAVVAEQRHNAREDEQT